MTYYVTLTSSILLFLSGFAIFFSLVFLYIHFNTPWYQLRFDDGIR